MKQTLTDWILLVILAVCLGLLLAGWPVYELIR